MSKSKHSVKKVLKLPADQPIANSYDHDIIVSFGVRDKIKEKHLSLSSMGVVKGD
jgi:hypothetical protein